MGRRVAALAVAVLAVVAAAGCAGSKAPADEVGRPPGSASAPRTTGTDDPVEVALESTDTQPSDTQVDDPLPDHEELSEPAPSTTEAPTTTTADDPSSSSTTSTARREPVKVSTKREPTGPGVPTIPTYTQTREEVLYFECVTLRESSNNPTVINSSSGAAGLFQFLQSTWDLVARRVGRGDLVGVNPALASVPTQRYLAHVLFLWQGSSPWVSDGCQVPSPPTTTTSTTSTTSTSTTSTQPPDSPPTSP
jgi:hypothetical protein